MFYILPSYKVFKIQYIFYIQSNSQSGPAKFRVLNSHVRLATTLLYSTFEISNNTELLAWQATHFKIFLCNILYDQYRY